MPDSRLEQRPSPLPVDDEFRAFFNTEYTPLLSFATFWCKSHHDADEAVAYVMEYMYERWATISNPQAYARRAVTRRLMNMHRDRGTRSFPVPGDLLPEGVDDAVERDRLENEQWVAELLAVLPPTQYAVFRRFLDGLSMTEIAGELRKKESTVRQNLKLARDRLLPHVSTYDRRSSCPSGERQAREEDR